MLGPEPVAIARATKAVGKNDDRNRGFGGGDVLGKIGLDGYDEISGGVVPVGFDRGDDGGTSVGFVGCGVGRAGRGKGGKH